MICDILDAVENGSFVPTHQVNNVEKNKHTNLWTKQDIEKMQYNLKVEIIITTALGTDEFFCASHYNIVKEMWDTLKVTYESATKVKRTSINMLTMSMNCL